MHVHAHTCTHSNMNFLIPFFLPNSKSPPFVIYAVWDFVRLMQYDTTSLTMSPKNLCAFVLLRLDYCNSLLVGCPKYLLSKFQKIQNNAAKLIFRTFRSAHITPMLQSLPWLSVEQMIEYKFCLCFKIISHQSSIIIKTFFTFMLLPGSSALLQTPEYLEYHPSA